MKLLGIIKYNEDEQIIKSTKWPKCHFKILLSYGTYLMEHATRPHMYNKRVYKNEIP